MAAGYSDWPFIYACKANICSIFDKVLMLKGFRKTLRVSRPHVVGDAELPPRLAIVAGMWRDWDRSVLRLTRLILPQF